MIGYIAIAIGVAVAFMFILRCELRRADKIKERRRLDRQGREARNDTKKPPWLHRRSGGREFR